MSKKACGAMRSNIAKLLKSLSGAICGATAEQFREGVQVLENIAEQFAELAEPIYPHTPIGCSAALRALRATQKHGEGIA